MAHTGFLENTRMFVTHEPKVNDSQTSRVKINVKQFSILYGFSFSEKIGETYRIGSVLRQSEVKTIPYSDYAM